MNLEPWLRSDPDLELGFDGLGDGAVKMVIRIGGGVGFVRLFLVCCAVNRDQIAWPGPLKSRAFETMTLRLWWSSKILQKQKKKQKK